MFVIKFIRQRNTCLEIMQGQLPDLVVTQPIVLKGGDIVALGFLLTVQ